MTKVIYFYGHIEHYTYACFSNFYPSQFTDVDNIIYHCSEQYLMAYKAFIMNDLNTMEKIMQTYNPYQCKKLGRQVKNWNQELWDQNKCDIMFDALYYKFSQNDDIRQKLLSTGNSTLAEASPRDRIWGIGLNISDAQSGKDWRGQNLLGKTLMRVRENLS
tara:strand:+ start:259 stop:741 length:483 start_codon:yes stop_codon:yes gene_type:complete